MKNEQVGVASRHHLSLKEITRAWANAAGESPELLMEELIKHFWRGKFETDGRSILIVLSKPQSPRWAPATSESHGDCADPIGFVERRPGDYAIRAGGEVVKYRRTEGRTRRTTEARSLSVART